MEILITYMVIALEIIEGGINFLSGAKDKEMKHSPRSYTEFHGVLKNDTVVIPPCSFYKKSTRK